MHTKAEHRATTQNPSFATAKPSFTHQFLAFKDLGCRLGLGSSPSVRKETSPPSQGAQAEG